MARCISPIRMKVSDSAFKGAYNEKKFVRFVDVPCGKCYYCRQNKVREWSFRLEQELKVCDMSFFITLTYDDEHLPIGSEETGTLNYLDVQLWLKRFRKSLKGTIKYHLVGEYGTRLNRPHYHLLLFYYRPRDADCESREYVQKMIEKTWQNGFTQIGPVKGGAIGYTNKYLFKFDKRLHDVEPFHKCSNGLGKSFLSPQMVSFLRQKKDMLAYNNSGFAIRLPRYYAEKVFSKDERHDINNGMLNDIPVGSIWSYIMSKGSHRGVKDYYTRYQRLLDNEFKREKEKYKL